MWKFRNLLIQQSSITHYFNFTYRNTTETYRTTSAKNFKKIEGCKSSLTGLSIGQTL